MSFEFRAHKPDAYYWFAFYLLFLIGVNVLLLYYLNPFLTVINEVVLKSVVLIVPWIVALFSPSAIGAVIIYNSFIKKLRFTLTTDVLSIERPVHGNSTAKKEYLWKEITGYRTSDFEGNHYFTILFRDKKENIIIHRDSGDFENFFSELKQYYSASSSLKDKLVKD